MSQKADERRWITLTAETIFDAVKEAGVRALVSAGWGGLGGTEIPEGVFILEGEAFAGLAENARLRPGNVPHDWLFADGRVSAVCHHGGKSLCTTHPSSES